MGAHPITLTLTTGRAGTTYLARVFQAAFGSEKACITHERLPKGTTRPDIHFRADLDASLGLLEIPAIAELCEELESASDRGPVVDFGWTMSPLIPILAQRYPERLRLLFVHRHPLRVAASKFASGSFTQWRFPAWCPTPDHAKAQFPSYRARWDRLSAFEKCLYGWLEVNAAAIERAALLPEIPFLEVRAEEIFGSTERLIAIATFLGFESGPNAFDRAAEARNESQRWNLEHRPLDADWRRIFEHPDVVALAERLDYSMAEDDLNRMAQKYALPAGPLPWIRYHSGYWPARKALGNWLRKSGLR